MKNDVVILCIGSNQVVGDSVGPMVGEYLREMRIQAYVYGTMRRPVNARNLRAYLDMIEDNHKDCTLIVVDSTVGERNDVGEIRVSRQGVRPGGALGKALPRIGDIGILGVVAKKSRSLISTLMSVDIATVERLSLKIGRLLLGTIASNMVTS